MHGGTHTPTAPVAVPVGPVATCLHIFRISSCVLFRSWAVGHRVSPRPGRHRGARRYRGGLVPGIPGDAGREPRRPGRSYRASRTTAWHLNQGQAPAHGTDGSRRSGTPKTRTPPTPPTDRPTAPARPSTELPARTGLGKARRRAEQPSLTKCRAWCITGALSRGPLSRGMTSMIGVSPAESPPRALGGVGSGSVHPPWRQQPRRPRHRTHRDRTRSATRRLDCRETLMPRDCRRSVDPDCLRG